MEIWDGSGISWTMCKQSAPRARQITTPWVSWYLIFYRPDALPDKALKAQHLLLPLLLLIADALVDKVLQLILCPSICFQPTDLFLDLEFLCMFILLL